MLGQRCGQLLGKEFGHAPVIARGHGGAVELQLRVRTQERERLDLHDVEAIDLCLGHIEAEPQRREIEGGRHQALRIDVHAQQVPRERLQERLVILGATPGERGGDSSAGQSRSG